MSMDDYRLAVLFSVFVLVPLAGWKITGMVNKLQKMSRRKEKEELSPKQKKFIEFLEKASNQSKNDWWKRSPSIFNWIFCWYRKRWFLWGTSPGWVSRLVDSELGWQSIYLGDIDPHFYGSRNYFNYYSLRSKDNKKKISRRKDNSSWW